MCGDWCERDRKECACVVMGVRGVCMCGDGCDRKECACVVMGVTERSVHV